MLLFSIFYSNAYRKKWKYYNKLIIFNIHGFYKTFRLLILLNF